MSPSASDPCLSVEVHKAQKRLQKQLSRAEANSSKSPLKLQESVADLVKVTDTGEVVYEATHSNLEAIFPEGGKILAKQLPADALGSSKQQLQALASKFNLPVKKY